MLEPARKQFLTGEIVLAYLGNHPVPADEVPRLIVSVHQALGSLEEAAPGPQERPKPAVPIGRSVQHDYIVCLEDGKKLKTLKRYLRGRYNLSPDEYRQRWSLPAEYPMTCPAYAQVRSNLAKASGLGKRVRRE